ncbi:hypothetical protein EIP91_011767 [Steccherinum ochraceum]|uniref:DUF1793-domain-containing protein n=1 Tax=Steccherinum ochraceum TaxID=92696 RepID=A0A4R0RKB1_9APHY|nr:hypothetical protein EIP91_011767 [Steccherinum ochraceum]
MLFNVTYMSPIETDDLVKQSIPFSYVYIDAVSTDGQVHDVQAYMDITGEWVTGNRSETVSWNGTKTSSSTVYQAQLLDPTPFKEVKDQAEDATAYIGMRSGPGVSFTVNGVTPCRGTFVTNGMLPAISADTSAPVSHNPIFAVAVDLGKISQTPQSIVWALGVTRTPAIAYTTGTGAVQTRAPYFKMKYPTVQDAIDAFLSDFSDAMQRANTFDTKIRGDTAAISPTFSTMVSLTARQVIGATDLTITKGSDGKWNTSDVKMFMKDVGTSGRVNPVETIYASLPFWLYLNPDYVGYLLEPLLEYQNSSVYTQPYAATDLGLAYPMATGNNQSHSQGVEHSGNMLIIALAHSQISGDGTFISRYYDLLFKWATYLVQTVPNAAQQVTADLESMPNMSNLLIKGIIGIQAMSKIGSALGRHDDAQQFSNQAQDLLKAWNGMGVSQDGHHVLAKYGDQNSWTLPYNFYADKLLQTNVIDNSFYSSETTFLKSLFSSASTPLTTFGVPIDSSINSQADSAWTLFTAAILTDNTVRDALIEPVYSALAATNLTTLTYAKVYKLDTGATVSGASSPALGAFFAPMALKLPFKTVVVPPPPPPPSSSKRSIVGPVVGGVIGGLGFIALIIVAVIFWRGRNRRRQRLDSRMSIDPAGFNQPVMVYGLPPGDIYSGLRPEADRDSNDALVAAVGTPMTTSVVSPTTGKWRERELILQASTYPIGSIRSPADVASPMETSVVSPTTTGKQEREQLVVQTSAPRDHAVPTPLVVPSHSDHTTSSGEPPSSVEPPSAVSPSSTEVQGLKEELDNLRRVVQDLQPPPGYSG